jgi:putative membrane protein
MPGRIVSPKRTIKEGGIMIGNLKGVIATATLLSPLALPAAEPGLQPVMRGVMLALLFSVIGVVALFLCFKAFDKAMTRIDIEEEVKKGNVAAGIVAGSLIIGISIIIAAAVLG